MKGSISIVLIVAYGIAWAWAGLHPYHAFFFLVFVGLLASMGVVAEAVINALPFIMVGIVFSLLTALFPPLAILETIFLLYMAYKNKRIIRRHLILIITGIVAYMILFYAPHRVLHMLKQGGSATGLLFGIGALGMLCMCYILRRMGYNERKTAMYIVGFPGFLFLIWKTWKDPSFRRFL